MAVRAAFALLALVALLAAYSAAAQAPARPPLTDDAVKEALIWGSPWAGRSSTPPSLYSYRVVFRQRRDNLIAEVTSLSTNQRSDSVVTITNGAIIWQDSNGAEVNVTLGPAEELVGTAHSSDRHLAIVLKPRP